jgi:hypothetical protein
MPILNLAGETLIIQKVGQLCYYEIEPNETISIFMNLMGNINIQRMLNSSILFS